MHPMILFSVLVAVGLASLYFGVVRFTRNTRPRWGECVALVAMGLFLLWTLIPTFNSAREKSRTVICSSNLKQLAMDLLMYAQDHQEHLPPADRWMDAIAPYLKGKHGPDPTLFRCPADGRDARYSYALNANLSACSLERILRAADTIPILLFESRQNVRNAAGTWKDLGGIYRTGEYRLFGMGWVRVEPGNNPETIFPHMGGGNFAFADGFVKWRRYGIPEVTEAEAWAAAEGAKP